MEIFGKPHVGLQEIWKEISSTVLNTECHEPRQGVSTGVCQGNLPVMAEQTQAAESSI